MCVINVSRYGNSPNPDGQIVGVTIICNGMVLRGSMGGHGSVRYTARSLPQPGGAGSVFPVELILGCKTGECGDVKGVRHEFSHKIEIYVRRGGVCHKNQTGIVLSSCVAGIINRAPVLISKDWTLEKVAERSTFSIS